MTNLGMSSVAGIRAFTPLALTLEREYGTQILYPVMVGEWLYDQYPKATDRTLPWSLFMRTVSGMTTAMLLEGKASTNWRDLGAAGLMGGIGAYSMTHLSYHVRKYLFENFQIPSSFLGSLEDVIAVFLSSHNTTCVGTGVDTSAANLVPDSRYKRPKRSRRNA